MNAVEWRPVHGFEGLYEVSNRGEIRSLERDLTLKCGKVRHYKSVNLSGGVDGKGYLTVNLTNGKTKKTFRFHRIVAEAFIPNPNGLPQVNHKDGNKLNNNVSNLEWCTDFENKQHARVHGLSARRDKRTGRWQKRSA